MDLARPGDPLVTEHGKLVEPEGRREPDYTLTIPIARHMVSTKPKSIRELGTDGQTQTVVNAVLMYHLIGIGRNEIAYILGTTISEVESIMKLPAFQSTFEMLFKELITASSNSIQARIQSYAGRALDNLMGIADTKPVKIKKMDDTGEEFDALHFDVNPMVIVKANDSILDRAGLNADHLYGKDQEVENQQLEIEITTADSNKTNVRVSTKR